MHIIKGEIYAGNDNPILIREMKTVLYKLMKNGIINQRMYGDIMSEIVNLI
jgi:hypothetical protein